MKIMVAGMGNVLRGDDGFGITVIQELIKHHQFTEDIDLYEAGIGFVQELMNGYDALIIVDAIDKGAAAGTLFVVEPLENKVEIDNGKLHQSMVDMHYADPSKVLLLARALKVCPPKVFLVGCQPEYVDDAVEGLRPLVKRAVPQAVEQILFLIDELTRA
jgi:hydrogenase maturation protease